MYYCVTHELYKIFYLHQNSNSVTCKVCRSVLPQLLIPLRTPKSAVLNHQMCRLLLDPSRFLGLLCGLNLSSIHTIILAAAGIFGTGGVQTLRRAQLSFYCHLLSLERLLLYYEEILPFCKDLIFSDIYMLLKKKEILGVEIVTSLISTSCFTLS